MQWTPSEKTRVIALVGALILFIIGIAMMWQGISAEGTLDIKSSLVSGSLKTGSAGLFIAFLAFLIISFVLLGGRLESSPADRQHNSKPKSQVVGSALKWFVIGVVISAGLAVLGFGDGFGMLAGFFAMLTFMAGVVYIALIDSE